MQLRDWFRLENPSIQSIEELAKIPGAKFEFAQGKVNAVRLHRTLWPVAQFAGMHFDESLTVASEATLFAAAKTLRDYQHDDLPFLLNRRSSILGYEMRLGKTATATCAHDPANGPLLIIGPLIARDVWRNWVEKVHGFAPVALESKNDIPLPGFPAYFCHFDILDAHSAFLQTLKPGTLVIDEIHMLQARRSLRMSTCSLVASNANRIIGLSGTPMWSNPRSMWPILNLLAPGAWGSEFEFCQRYMKATNTAYGWKYEGTNNEDEFRQRLSEVIVRRTWEDVAPQLPPTINVVEPVCISASDLSKLELQAERTRLSHAHSGKRDVAVAALASLRLRYGKAKVKRAVELAEQAMRDGHKVLLWTWHTEVADALSEALYEKCGGVFYTLTAEQTQDTRAHQISGFQNHGVSVAMIIPLAVGGVAIDLSSADVNIFVEQDWIPATNYQASMRVFKPGRPHSNVWMHLDVPVERRLMEVLGANEGCQTAVGLGYDEIANRILGPSNF